MRLSELGEDPFVARLAERFGRGGRRIIKGIGDDTSVTTTRGGKVMLATTDATVEGTHFKRVWLDPRLLGRKSLSISISDIAAMGGDPVFFLVSLVAPPSTETTLIDDIYLGISEVARDFRVALAGGNTSRSSKGLSITTTVIGEADPARVVYRKGARAGDAVFVTGTVGDSALGLSVLKKDGLKALKGPWKGSVTRHLDPAPRLAAGRELARRSIATAMIDLSDGVILDLRRLAAESGVGATIETSSLPFSTDLEKYARGKGRRRAEELALGGGEDYELLFTAAPKDAPRIKRLASRLGVPITRVGEITRHSGKIDVLDENGEPARTTQQGFLHF